MFVSGLISQLQDSNELESEGDSESDTESLQQVMNMSQCQDVLLHHVMFLYAS